MKLLCKLFDPKGPIWSNQKPGWTGRSSLDPYLSNFGLTMIKTAIVLFWINFNTFFSNLQNFPIFNFFFPFRLTKALFVTAREKMPVKFLILIKAGHSRLTSLIFNSIRRNLVTNNRFDFHAKSLALNKLITYRNGFFGILTDFCNDFLLTVSFSGNFK